MVQQSFVNLPFDRYTVAFNQALADEIQSLRKNGGQRTFVNDGCYLGKRGDRYLYSFTADTELFFPDDTPIDLEYRHRKHSGVLISTEGFDLIIGLDSSLPDKEIATAILFTEPWFLLEELKKRFSEIPYRFGSNIALATQLLDKKGQLEVPHQVEGKKLLSVLEQRLGKSFETNEHQQFAIDTVLNRPVSFIWGPPGTGKTKTLGMTVAALVQAGESVLVVAHSNAAVDTAMLSVAQCLQNSSVYQEGLVLRYGTTQLTTLGKFPKLHVRGILREKNPDLIVKIEGLETRKKVLIKQSRQEKLSNLQGQRIKAEIEQVKKELEPLKQELKQKEAELIGKATVVGCTFSKVAIAPEIYRRRFDAAIVDEASMAYIPQCVFASILAKRRIAIFGDFRQLGPISQATTAAAKDWLHTDIFEEAGITEAVNRGYTDPRLVMLQSQYRMHPDISAIPNHLFYKGLLKDGLQVAQQTMPTVNSQPCPGNALVLYDLGQTAARCFSEKQSNSRFNLISALIAVHIAYQNLQAGQDRIGIITPYNAQSRLIQRLFKDLRLSEEKVKAATVHRFQGSEQDLIIFDAVDGYPKREVGRLLAGGMNSTAMRLSNVTISRARGKFVGLVNYDYIQNKLNPSDAFRQLIDRVAKRGRVEKWLWSNSAIENGNLILPGVTYFSTSRAASQAIEGDLGQAKEEIGIYWPTSLASYHFSASALQQGTSDRVRCFVGGVGCQSFGLKLGNTRVWDSRSHNDYGLVGIDRKCLWVYLDPSSPAGGVLRIELAQTVKLLYAFWCLVPDDEVKQGTLEERVARGNLVGLPCPTCGNALWPQEGRLGPYLACTNHKCSYTKPISSSDATNLARLSGTCCGKCRGQVKGRKSDRGVFLGCTNYPQCDWTLSLTRLV